MQNYNQIFDLKIRELHKKIFSSSPVEIISYEIDALLDFIYKNEIIDRKTNLILINSLKITNENNEKLQKLIHKLSQNSNESKLILEINSEFPVSTDEIKISNAKNETMICSDLINGIKDFHCQFFLLSLESTTIVENKKIITINELYQNHFTNTEDELKKQIKFFSSDKLEKGQESLQFAEILSKAGYHSKSYDIVKKNYKTNYNHSFKILTNILENCKNEKLNQSVLLFIKEKRIKEKGFSAELLDGIIEEIEGYFKENPKSR